MNGPGHYAKAEHVLAQVEDRDVSAAEVAAFTAVAQVHATLALVAAYAASGVMRWDDHDEWDRTMGRPEVTP